MAMIDQHLVFHWTGWELGFQAEKMQTRAIKNTGDINFVCVCHLKSHSGGSLTRGLGNSACWWLEVGTNLATQNWTENWPPLSIRQKLEFVLRTEVFLLLGVPSSDSLGCTGVSQVPSLVLAVVKFSVCKECTSDRSEAHVTPHVKVGSCLLIKSNLPGMVFTAFWYRP